VLRTPLRLLLVAGLLTGCAGSAPEPAERTDAVVVASFDFAESAVLGEIYAQALESAGVPVRRELRLGSRELVLPALRQGLVDVVPEYVGTALATVAPTAAAATRTGEAVSALGAALAPAGLRPLRPAAAQNQNGLAVTRATAQRLGLRRTSDLQPFAAGLALAGPTECPRRPYCVPGLRRAYGLTFQRFVAYDAETQRVTALEQGLVDVAVVFTTDGLLTARDLVLLADDRHLQPVENVVPVVSDRAVRRYGVKVEGVLDAVSARLDSAALTFLNWRVDVAGGDARDEARGWLLRHDLLPR
jgi:osmoprotectant transport system substrate-binding protein